MGLPGSCLQLKGELFVKTDRNLEMEEARQFRKITGKKGTFSWKTWAKENCLFLLKSFKAQNPAIRPNKETTTVHHCESTKMKETV